MRNLVLVGMMAVAMGALAGELDVAELVGKIVVIRSVNSSSYAIDQSSNQARIVKVKMNKDHLYAFKVVKGLSDPKHVSFECYSSPGKYLRQQLGRLYISPSDKSEDFNRDATFMIEKGIAGGSEAVSMRSMGYPDEYVSVNKKKELITELNPKQKKRASFIFKDAKIKTK